MAQLASERIPQAGPGREQGEKWEKRQRQGDVV
jgi:hypothetical protein